MIITGKTSSGFDYALDVEALKSDFRFIRALRRAQSYDETEQVSGAVDLISAVFSDPKEEDRFYAHIAKVYGNGSSRVPADKVYAEISEIFKKTSETTEVKN